MQSLVKYAIILPVLKRKIDEKLNKWKNSYHKVPLIVEGARQVGKTFSILKFGAENYENVIHINFILNPEYCEIFSGSLDVDTLISMLTIYMPGQPLVSGKTLIFLDEIQDCPNALVALKSFAIDKRFDVIASGSLLGMISRISKSYPVGYCETITMYPLDFEEFLWGLNYGDSFTNILLKSFNDKKELPAGLCKKISLLFRTYMIVGGLPKAVMAYIETKDFNNVESEKARIIDGYFKDIAKYGDTKEKNKAQDLFVAIPHQLTRENKKFQFSKVKKHARSRDYEDSLKWLYESGVVQIIRKQESFTDYNDISTEPNYRVFFKDTGLLVSMYKGKEIPMNIINGQYFINNGALIDNIIAESLNKQFQDLTFYKRESGLEVEFIIRHNQQLIPISLKKNIQFNQTLNLLFSEDTPFTRFGFKLTDDNFKFDDNIYTIPFYAVFLIDRFIKIINDDFRENIEAFDVSNGASNVTEVLH